MTVATKVTVRQSLLGSADKCLRSFQYSLERPEGFQEGGSIQRSLGTGYHNGGMEPFYKALMLGHPVPTIDDSVALALTEMHDDIAKADPENFKWSKEITDVDAADLKLASMVRTYFEEEHYWPEDFKVLGVEHTFDFPYMVYGQPVHGTMDLVLEDPLGYIVIVDHKTCGRMWDSTKHKPRKQNQPAFYTRVAKLIWPDRPGYRFVYDIMSYAGKFERRISDPTEAHEQAVWDKAEQLVALYKMMRGSGLDLPVNPSSTLCSPAFCDFWPVCPQGEALDN